MSEPTELELAVARAIDAEAWDDAAFAGHPRADADDMLHSWQMSRQEKSLETARRAIAACFRWQPIETAPTDKGRWILVTAPNLMPVPAMFFKGAWRLPWWVSNDKRVHELQFSPTHWMPLPFLPRPEDTPK